MYGNKVCVLNKFHTDLITQVLWVGMSLHVTQANWGNTTNEIPHKPPWILLLTLSLNLYWPYGSPIRIYYNGRGQCAVPPVLSIHILISFKSHRLQSVRHPTCCVFLNASWSRLCQVLRFMTTIAQLIRRIPYHILSYFIRLTKSVVSKSWQYFTIYLIGNGLKSKRS